MQQFAHETGELLRQLINVKRNFVFGGNFVCKADKKNHEIDSLVYYMFVVFEYVVQSISKTH